MDRTTAGEQRAGGEKGAGTETMGLFYTSESIFSLLSLIRDYYISQLLPLKVELGLTSIQTPVALLSGS